MIMAIDELKGSPSWRRKSEALSKEGSVKKRIFLLNLKGLIAESNEGYMMDLVKTAMSAGAAGATVKKARFAGQAGVEETNIKPAREIGNFIIGEDQTPQIADTVGLAMTLNKIMAGVIEIKTVNKAFTYLGK
jgi:hypothetical protein